MLDLFTIRYVAIAIEQTTVLFWPKSVHERKSCLPVCMFVNFNCFTTKLNSQGYESEVRLR